MKAAKIAKVIKKLAPPELAYEGEEMGFIVGGKNREVFLLSKHRVLDRFIQSFRILNFNSPGATGAPAYTARIIKLLEEKGKLNHLKRRVKPIKSSPWNFKEISLLLNFYK